MICAYVLIQTSLGSALNIVKEVGKIKGVKKACAVTGAYDILATVEVEKLADIGDLVVNKIHCLEGVCGTQTLICVTC